MTTQFTTELSINGNSTNFRKSGRGGCSRMLPWENRLAEVVPRSCQSRSRYDRSAPDITRKPCFEPSPALASLRPYKLWAFVGRCYLDGCHGRISSCRSLTRACDEQNDEAPTRARRHDCVAQGGPA
ncbi:hypothetical protein KM043_002785 [Ampulex compressa]|nr:hypothetical protein KM043_002785 [Ampulex compressa]